MATTLKDYKEIAPPGRVDLLYRLAKQLRGRRLLHVNSTRSGGGVAEILQNLIPLLRDLGLDVGWDTVSGPEAFYDAARCFHNGLQGEDVRVPDDLVDAFVEGSRENARRLDLGADVVVTHDPLPLALIEAAPTDSRWVWRCYLDVSRPQRRVWNILRPYVAKYDAAVYSLPQFAQPLAVPQFLIYPSIDPLSDKNRELSEAEIDRQMEALGVPRDKPILLQVSRFNHFKDPLGVLAAYRLVKTHFDCRLVMAGGIPSDDPDDQHILGIVREAADKDRDVHVLLLKPGSNLEINALQRAAAVVIQKSIREGFGLTVTEAMWKRKPVIAGETGGLTLQVQYAQTGYTVNSVEGLAFYARHLLNNPQLADVMGQRGQERVRQNFLITRQVEDYLSLMLLLGRT